MHSYYCSLHGFLIKIGMNNMSRKRKFSKPFDLCHSILFNEFPKEYVSTIGVPGNFVKEEPH